MLAHNFAFADLNLAYHDLVNNISSVASLSYNTLDSAQPEANGEPWLALDEPTWLDVRAEAFYNQCPVRNSSDSPPNTPDKSDGTISAAWNDEDLDGSDTSSFSCESSPDNSGSTSPSDDTSDCDWEDLLFERPSSSLGFREEEEGESKDIALARASCVDIDVEFGLVASSSRPTVSGTPSEPQISSQEVSRLLRLRTLLDSSTKSRASIHQSRKGEDLELIQEEEFDLLEEEEEKEGTSEPPMSRWSPDSCEELDDGLIDPYSCDGAQVLTSIKRWLILPSDLEPLTVLYRLSALKDTLVFLPGWIPTKTNLVRGGRFLNIRSRADIRHGNTLFLACLRQLRWGDLLPQVGKVDRDWIQGFLSALESPGAPPVKYRKRSRTRRNKSSLRNVITAKCHLEAEENLAPPRVLRGYDAETKGQGLQHGFQYISKRIQGLGYVTWDILCKVEDLETRAYFLDVRLEFLDAKIEGALEEEEAAFGSRLGRLQVLQVRL